MLLAEVDRDLTEEFSSSSFFFDVELFARLFLDDGFLVVVSLLSSVVLVAEEEEGSFALALALVLGLFDVLVIEASSVSCCTLLSSVVVKWRLNGDFSEDGLEGSTAVSRGVVRLDGSCCCKEADSLVVSLFLALGLLDLFGSDVLTVSAREALEQSSSGMEASALDECFPLLDRFESGF